MKILRTVLCAAMICFLLFTPAKLVQSAQKSYVDPRFERDPDRYTGSIVLYHIVRHRPYAGSLTQWLKRRAEAYEKKHHDNINKKLDFIIHNMKDPMNANFDELNEKEVDDDGNEICDEYSYYDSPEYIIEEEMPKLYQIAEEIGKIASIADYYNIYSREDIRIIYYIE